MIDVECLREEPLREEPEGTCATSPAAWRHAMCDIVGNMPAVQADSKQARAAGLSASGPNAAMIEHWNDVVGPGWVRGQEAIDAHLEPLGRLALDHAAPQPGESVLDVGCGCGATALELATRVGSAGRVTGVDLSAPMLTRAAERARSSGFEHATFINADAQSVHFETRFDLAFSRFGVMFFSDFTAAFRNLRRALVPGGRICFVCWRELDRNPWMGVPMAAASRHVAVPDPAAPGKPGPYGLANRESLQGWLVDAGFETPEISSLDIGLPVRGGVDVEDAAAFMSAMGPVAAALRGADESKREPVREALAEAMRPFATDGVVVLGASAWLVSSRNPG